MSGDAPQALGGLRVLEVGDEKSQLTGKLLADLGADVILVEPREGSALPPRRPLLRRRSRRQPQPLLLDVQHQQAQRYPRPRHLIAYVSGTMIHEGLLELLPVFVG